MKQLWLLLLASPIVFAACKKTEQPAPPDPTPTATTEDLLKDSVYLYTKEVYLWTEVIPSYESFNPRKYSNGADNLETAQKVMNGIKALEPKDRFSMVLSKEASDGLQTGEDKDFGFFIKAASLDRDNTMDSVYWFVNYVYDQSSAGQGGVQRGWYINKINGTTMKYDNPSVTILNNTFFGTATSASFEFVKPDGTTATLNLSKTSFTANSVLYKDVISTAGKKVGYLVFNQFFGAPSRTELTNAFSYFQSQGVNEMVVDLRYNPGGSVETQDMLANILAPSSADGKTMYQYIFNSTLQNNQHELIRKKLGYGNMFAPGPNTIQFAKSGTINLPRIFFIVSGNSASASELLINNLKPYMDVKLIGDDTYGKPVGFFPIPVYNVDIYPISFKTVNSAGSADYYNGFAPDYAAPNGVNRNWGDVNEPGLAAALRYISTGSFGRYSAEMQSRVKAMKQTRALNLSLSDKKFSGMFIEK